MAEDAITITSKRFMQGGATPKAEPPTGDDRWRLVSAVPIRVDDEGGLVMYWTWTRPAKKRFVNCPTPTCSSVARKDGKCIACGAVIPEEG